MDWTSKLAETLREAGLEVERDGARFEIDHPIGADDRTVRVDPSGFLEELPDDEGDARRALAAYASGIRHVLLEPADSDADELEFTDVAGQLGMALHAAPFVAGTEAAAGSPAWASHLVDDLYFICFIELDRGTRVLTEDQFERWSATTDRLMSGARSMLFHKAQHTDPEAVEGREGVERLRVGDGYDGARILVLGDLMYGEFDDSSRFAMPTPNDLLFVRDGSAAAVGDLRRAAEDLVAKSDYPLGTRLFELDRGTPRAVEGADGSPTPSNR